MRKLVMTLTPLLVASTLVGLSSVAKAQSSDQIVFGLFGPMSGPYSAFGTRFREAANMFLDEVNDKGGIEGRKLVVRMEDSRGNPRESANIAQKFSDDKEMIAVIGGWSSTESMAAAPIFQEANMPQISPTASHPDYTKISAYQFRMTNTQSSLATVHADLLVNKLGMKRIVIAYFQDDWGLSVNKLTTPEVEKLGSEVIMHEAMIPDSRDFRPLITKIKAANPDGIFLASHYQESAVFMQQLRQAKVDVKVAATDTLQNPKFVELAGPAANGVVLPSYYFAEDPSTGEFTNAYMEKHGRLPDYYAVFGYDAVSIATEAARTLIKAGKPLTRDNMRDAIHNMQTFPGVGGDNKFDEIGDVVKPMRFLEINDEKYALFK